MNKFSSKNWGQERGVYLGLLAVLMPLVLAVLVFLFIGESAARNAQSELHTRVENICTKVARFSMLQRQAVILFDREVSGILGPNNGLVGFGEAAQGVPRVRITKATLMVPTMPALSGGGQTFPFPAVTDPFSNQTGDISAYPPITLASTPAASPPGYTFQALLGSARTCPAGLCFFENAISRTGSQAGYPLTIGSHIYQAGAVVGCTLEAVVNQEGTSFLSRTRNIRAFTVRTNHLRGASSAPGDNGFNAGNPVGVNNYPVPGLTIGVDPVLPVLDFRNPGLTEQESRWLFGAPENSSSGWTQTFTGIPSPSFVPPSTPYSSSLFRPFYDFLYRTCAYYSGGAISAFGFMSTLENNMTVTNNATYRMQSNINIAPSQRAEAITACYNPLVLIRNRFLVTLMSLSSRHAQLRNMLELVIANPQHATVTAVSVAGGPPVAPLPLTTSNVYMSNSPVRVIGFGQDILRQDYQLPYITYHHEPSTGFLNPRKGWMIPYEVHNSDPFSRTFDSLMSRQLRACFHMYSSSQMKRASSLMEEMNEDFDPAATAWISRDEPAPGPSWRRLDQDEPWSEFLSGSPQHRMNSVELAGTLGAVQDCPYRGMKRSNVTNSDCIKPYRPRTSRFEYVYHIRPDYVGMLRYISNLGEGYESPGLFPYLNPNPALSGIAWNQDGAAIFPSTVGTGTKAVYTRPATTKSVVLLVIHSAPSSIRRVGATGPTEVELIRSEVTELQARNRRLLVVFFPANKAEHCALPDIRDAFNIGAINSENELLVFSPYGNGTNDTWPTCSLDSDEDDTFANYWQSLLTDPVLGIDQQAANFFSERLLVNALAF